MTLRIENSRPTPPPPSILLFNTPSLTGLSTQSSLASLKEKSHTETLNGNLKKEVGLLDKVEHALKKGAAAAGLPWVLLFGLVLALGMGNAVPQPRDPLFPLKLLLGASIAIPLCLVLSVALLPVTLGCLLLGSAVHLFNKNCRTHRVSPFPC